MFCVHYVFNKKVFSSLRIKEPQSEQMHARNKTEENDSEQVRTYI